MDAYGSLPSRRAQAVSTGVAPADDYDILASGSEIEAAVDLPPAYAPVLLRQKVHREVDPIQIATRDWQVPGLLRANAKQYGVVLRQQFAGL